MYLCWVFLFFAGLGIKLIKQAIIYVIGSICEDIAGGLSADNWKTCDSALNKLWNAVLFAGVYTPLFPPERILCHDCI